MSKPHWIPAKTYPDAPHEYIRRQDNPALFSRYQKLIAEHGRAEEFTLRGVTRAYRYFYGDDGFKYWTVGSILNRVKV